MFVAHTGDAGDCPAAAGGAVVWHGDVLAGRAGTAVSPGRVIDERVHGSLGEWLLEAILGACPSRIPGLALRMPLGIREGKGPARSPSVVGNNGCLAGDELTG